MLPSLHELISGYLALKVCKNTGVFEPPTKPKSEPKSKSIDLNCSEKETQEAIKKVTRK